MNIVMVELLRAPPLIPKVFWFGWQIIWLPCVSQKTRSGFPARASEALSYIGSSLELLSELSKSGSPPVPWVPLSPFSILGSLGLQLQARQSHAESQGHPKNWHRCTQPGIPWKSWLGIFEQLWSVLCLKPWLISISHPLGHWGSLAWDPFSLTVLGVPLLGH